MFTPPLRHLPSPPSSASSSSSCAKDPTPAAPTSASTSTTPSIYITPPKTKRKPKSPRPTSFLYLISSFIRSEFGSGIYGSRDLSLTAIDIDAFLDELRSPRVLSSREAESLRYDYCPETETLTIPCMPGALHNSVVTGSEELLMEMGYSGFLSRAERASIVIGSGTDVQLPNMPSYSRDGSKTPGGTAIKQPDVAFYHIDKTVQPWCRDSFPRVVFEIGFSQKHATVTKDAKDWLIRSNGFVKLVVAIKLTEGPIPPTIQVRELSDGIAQHLAINSEQPPAGDQPGDGPGQQSVASPAGSQHSTAEQFDDFVHNDSAPWVGPVSGTLELYRFDPATSAVWRDGPVYDLFGPVSGPGPQIHIADLLPDAKIEGDRTRTFPIPFEHLRQHIGSGVRNMAVARRIASDRARKRARPDPDYQNSEDSKSEEDEIPRQSKRTRVAAVEAE